MNEAIKKIATVNPRKLRKPRMTANSQAKSLPSYPNTPTGAGSKAKSAIGAAVRNRQNQVAKPVKNVGDQPSMANWKPPYGK